MALELTHQVPDSTKKWRIWSWEMWLAEMMRQPFGKTDVKPRLGWIAHQIDMLLGAVRIAFPFEIRQMGEGDVRGIGRRRSGGLRGGAGIGERQQSGGQQ